MIEDKKVYFFDPKRGDTFYVNNKKKICWSKDKEIKVIKKDK